jgi:hypothetical protein
MTACNKTTVAAAWRCGVGLEGSSKRIDDDDECFQLVLLFNLHDRLSDNMSMLLTEGMARPSCSRFFDCWNLPLSHRSVDSYDSLKWQLLVVAEDGDALITSTHDACCCEHCCGCDKDECL